MFSSKNTTPTDALRSALLSVTGNTETADKGLIAAINAIHDSKSLAVVKATDDDIDDVCDSKRDESDQMVVTHQGGRAFPVDIQALLMRLVVVDTSETIYRSKAAMEATVMNRLIPHLCSTEPAGLEALALLIHVDINRMAYRRKNLFLMVAFLAKLGKTELVRKSAMGAFLRMVRTLNDFAHFIMCYENIGLGITTADGKTHGTGWGRAFKAAVQGWFNSKKPDQLLYSFSKYKGRRVTYAGKSATWTWADLLRLCKVKPSSKDHALVYGYAKHGELKATYVKPNTKDAPQEKLTIADASPELREQYQAILAAEAVTCADDALEVITKYGRKVAWEHYPSEVIRQVYHVVLPKMPPTALMRNLNKVDYSKHPECVKAVELAFGTQAAVAKTQLNPVNLLIAALTYQQGKGMRSDATWKVDPRVVAIMEMAVNYSFHTCDWTTKNVELDLDISGSMSSTFGDTPMSCAQMTGVIAYLALLRNSSIPVYGFSDILIDLKKNCTSYAYGRETKGFIGEAKSYQDLLKRMSDLNFGYTIPSLGIKRALKEFRDNPKEHTPVDAFVIITDCETGDSRASEAHLALRAYREAIGNPKVMLIVIGLTANNFTVADPKDPYMLDIAGFEPTLFSSLVAFIDSDGGTKLTPDLSLCKAAHTVYTETRAKLI